MDLRGMRMVATLMAVVGLLLVGGLSGAAQHSTPMAGEAQHAHPAHIHLGSCDALDPNPTFPLSDVALAPGDADTQDGGASAIPVERSATTVDATLGELHSGGYAINVHQSVEDIGTYIACGSLSGAIDDSGALVVGLGELNDSGHSGVAVLTSEGEQTLVTVYLTEAAAGAAGAATSATTGDDTAVTADTTMVDIKDFAYVPDPVEIAVGTTVTWTNSDTVPHTATAQDRQVLQSGTLNPGDTFSQTFATPGTFDYFCEFHPNMKGTIVVQ
jgi:plastocyanin